MTASVPQFTGVGETTTNDGSVEIRRYGDPTPEPGELLSLPKPDAAKKALELYKSQDAVMDRLEAQAQANAYRRAGYADVRVLNSPDDARYIARIPLDSRGNARSPDALPHMNKSAALCRKMTGVLTADPPAADAVPGEGEDQDGDDAEAAEFASRALTDLDETMREVAGLRDAIDRAHNSGSVFRRYWYRSTGGPRMPIEVQAGYDPQTGEEAQNVNEAEFRKRMVPAPEDPAMMGMPVPPREVTEPWPEFRRRMVTPDGMLTDEKKGAATQAVGEICAKNYTINNVRLIPDTCESIEDAYGIQCALFEPWGKLRQDFPELNDLSDEDRSKILSYRPKEFEGAIPAGQKRRFDKVNSGNNVDAKRCLTLTTYYTGKKSNDYPMGLYMVQVGESHILHRSTLSYTDGNDVEQPMSLPFAQVRLFTEARDHPYGVGLMEIVGPGGEVRAAMLAAALDALDRIGSAKTFVDAMSDLQPEELNDRSRRYLFTKFANGMPVTEQVQGMPAEAQFILETLTQEMNDASGLQETGQGLEAGSVTSGIQAMTVVSQVQAALSPQAGAVVDAYLRGCRVRLELVQAHYTIPRTIKWSTEDGRYKQRAWSRSDLGSTADVRLKPGTMSMLRPVQKAMLAVQYLQQGILPPDEFRDATEHNMGGTLALQSDPFRLRIRRQISDWKEGPPQGWTPPQPPPPAMGVVPGPMGEPMQVPMEQQPAPPDPLLMKIWEPVPSDTDPKVAQVRYHELCKLTASTAYQRKPPEWRMAVDQEFAKMQQVTQMMQQPQMPMQGQQGAQEAQQQPGDPGAPTRQHEAAQQSAMRMPVGAA